MLKYPKVKAATEEITAMLEKEPNIDKETLRKRCSHI